MSFAIPTARATYRRGVLLVAGAMLAWSTAGLLARLVATDPWTTLFWRSIYAGLSLGAYLVWRDGAGLLTGFRRLGVAGWAMAACFGASMMFFINALAHTSVAAVLVFQAVSPLFAAALAWIMLRERVSAPKLTAILFCLAAMVFIVADGDPGRLIGNLLSFGMAITYSGSVVLARQRTDVPTTEATLVGVIMVAIVSAPFASFTVQPHEMALLAGFGVVQMGLALVMFTTGVRLIPAADAGLISILEAVLAPVWVWLAFGEDPGWRTLVGGAVVMTAVLLTAWHEARSVR
jgi:drug/metabolite transporter (DMT)-like permease